MKPSKPLRIAMWVLQILLGALFIYTGFQKLHGGWMQFATDIAAYEMIPDNAVIFLANWLPWFELVLGVFLLAGVWRRWVGIVTSLLLGGFMFGMVRAYHKGLNINCGCGLPGGDKVGPITLARDGSFLVLSLALTILAFIAARKIGHGDTETRRPESAS